MRNAFKNLMRSFFMLLTYCFIYLFIFIFKQARKELNKLIIRVYINLYKKSFIETESKLKKAPNACLRA